MLSAKEILEYVHDTRTMSEEKQFSLSEAKHIGESLGIGWDTFDVEQFATGLNVELEHGRTDPKTDVTHDEPMLTGKIALAHLNKTPDYYTRLAVMEQAEPVKCMQRSGGM
jgi:hypothetical protein